MSERKKIYDEMSGLLTEYESVKENDDVDYVDYADRFYLILRDIQRKWKDVITSDTDVRKILDDERRFG